MKLSIIIPCHNNESTIMKTIKSIYSSNNINKYKFEIVVVDDFSLDGSYSLIKRNFPTVKICKLKKHSGAAKARNVGIKKSKGNLLLFIDADAWFNKTTIHNLIKLLDENTDIVFPKITYENGHMLYPLFEQEKKYPHISCCFAIKKNSLKKLDGLFDEFYQTYLEDYDFFIRCKLDGLKAKYEKNARVIHANKELNKDYSERYYLEVRNIIYGRKKIGAQGPFLYSNLVKAFFAGIFNFAWFNWYSYDRTLNNWDKFKLLFKHSNKITNENLFSRISIFFKGISQGFVNK